MYDEATRIYLELKQENHGKSNMSCSSLFNERLKFG